MSGVQFSPNHSVPPSGPDTLEVAEVPLSLARQQALYGTLAESAEKGQVAGITAGSPNFLRVCRGGCRDQNSPTKCVHEWAEVGEFQQEAPFTKCDVYTSIY